MSRHTKPGRNDLCACGSGKKFKNCCEAKVASSSWTSR
ncbi:MAG TPA: SEC-C metal-binding domain-containing protein, partial [Thermoleophilia bacterium]|nr:SEC-C metal-binding domain-containing protein [Thermoleophilia bacterium]